MTSVLFLHIHLPQQKAAGFIVVVLGLRAVNANVPPPPWERERRRWTDGVST